ncbi:hypothetical protein P43SY_006545 [Pythium insidiosum]|uniref:Complex 1 LYR protein domain-containing protein n=1 Tax=Pythium insidiosum TaxID=114742 RepID=A0AAD5LF87_PYTIN|nr:hypothetical protein P43SY_006545 [Pythium insidiosum]
MMRRQVLAFYRDVVRAARAFPDRSVGRKLQFNVREVLRLRREETDAAAIASHLADGARALRVIALLQNDSALLTAIMRKPLSPRGSGSGSVSC